MTEMGRSTGNRDRPVPLIMLVGIPGSGKSTWAGAYLRDHPAHYLVSTDQIRAELYGDEAIQGDWRQVWRQVVSRWRLGIDGIHRGVCAGVVYDATNARRRHRRQAISAARALGFNCLTLVWVDAPLGVCLRRNRLRSRQVPPEAIVKMHRQLRGAPPSLAEGVDQIIRITPAETD